MAIKGIHMWKTEHYLAPAPTRLDPVNKVEFPLTPKQKHERFMQSVTWSYLAIAVFVTVILYSYAASQ